MNFKIGDLYLEETRPYFYNDTEKATIYQYMEYDPDRDMMKFQVLSTEKSYVSEGDIIYMDLQEASTRLIDVTDDLKLVAGKRKCRCPIIDLMNRGCKCGGA